MYSCQWCLSVNMNGCLVKVAVMCCSHLFFKYNENKTFIAQGSDDGGIPVSLTCHFVFHNTFGNVEWLLTV